MSRLDKLLLSGSGSAAPAATASGSDAAATATAAAADSKSGDVKSEYLGHLFQKMVKGVKAANAIPSGEDYKYYESFSGYQSGVSALSQQILTLMNRLCDKIQVSNPARTTALAAQQPQSLTRIDLLDDDLDRFNAVVDVADMALERVDLHLDEFKGLGKKHAPGTVATGQSAAGSAGSGSSSSSSGAGGGDSNGRGTKRSREMASLNSSSRSLMKPQIKFHDRIDNSTLPFVPVIKHKPNALVPLQTSSAIRVGTDGGSGSGGGGGSGSASKVATPESSPKLTPALEAHIKNLGFNPEVKNREFAPHPYEYEIRHLKYTPKQLQWGKETLYGPLNEVQCHWIDSEEDMQRLATKLEASTEFAVDLEHHSYRSYQGFTCLMQISTRTEDFLVDTLEMRHQIHVLNGAFSNPKIVKVLHGADSDVLWLQRDFGIYIVNMFDTGQAARVLDFPSFGLALADWRIRPLPAEMLLYARQDTHYLLYIYDRMKNELIETSQARTGGGGGGGASAAGATATTAAGAAAGATKQHSAAGSGGGGGSGAPAHLLGAVLERSQNVCLSRYEKEVVTPTSHLLLCSKFGLVYSEQQMRVLAALFVWRDSIARKEDESTTYVMPNHVLITICNTMPLDSSQLLDCCRPVPILVKQHLTELMSIIHTARLDPNASPALLPSAAALAKSAQLASITLNSTVPTAQSLLTQTPSHAATNAMSSLALSTPTPAGSGGNLFSSPVLSTPELYDRAGWIGGAATVDGSSSSNAEAIRARWWKAAAAAAESTGYVGPDGGPQGAAGVNLFDVSAIRTPHKAMPLDPERVLVSPQIPRPLLSFDAESDDESESGASATAEEAAAAERARAIHDSFRTQPNQLAHYLSHSNPKPLVTPNSKSNAAASATAASVAAFALQTPNKPITSGAGSGSNDTKREMHTPDTGEATAAGSSSQAAIEIEDDDSDDPNPKRNRKQPPAAAAVAATPTKPVGAGAGAGGAAGAGAGVACLSALSPAPPSLEQSQSPPPDPSIPRSMREIYRMSNQNRRRNKEKKKLKQSAFTDPTPAFDAGGPKASASASESTSTAGKQSKAGKSKSKSAAARDTGSGDDSDVAMSNTKPSAGGGGGGGGGGGSNEFMRDIGWIRSDGATDSSGSAAASTTPTPASGSSKRSSSAAASAPAPVQPFDYSQAVPFASAPPPPPSTDHFNPYTHGGGASRGRGGGGGRGGGRRGR